MDDIIDENKELERFKKKDKSTNWKPEQTIELETLMGSSLTINRILYIGDKASNAKPKRCISLTKNGKSVAFDIEMYQAVAAAMKKLGAGFELQES